MMRSLIAIAALMASVSASAGELDGKAVSCTQDGSPVETNWYKFVDDAVIGCFVSDDGATAKENCAEEGSYNTRVSTIDWSSLGTTSSLNRESLRLEMSFESSFLIGFQCSIPDSLEAWQDSIKAGVLHKQQAIYEQLKQNKI